MENQSIISSIAQILIRDIQNTIDEVSSYENNELLWVKEGAINNSAGNLALHIAGAIHHFIGAVLGDNGFVRDRDYEFNAAGTATEGILSGLNDAKNVVQEVLRHFTDEDLLKDFPAKILGNTMSIGHFLVHLTSHLSYHLGQINYHRRFLVIS
ncbi:DinB family protein [Parapedobacter tibetensis]|uniref:DinB family protein n=1 Tax=Parapedobacter tibetensis TaxID=2972951 RepID=UPI00214DA018|nr:DinB family protein [Parapedobacter tibetensis]